MNMTVSWFTSMHRSSWCKWNYLAWVWRQRNGIKCRRTDVQFDSSCLSLPFVIAFMTWLMRMPLRNYRSLHWVLILSICKWSLFSISLLFSWTISSFSSLSGFSCLTYDLRVRYDDSVVYYFHFGDQATVFNHCLIRPHRHGGGAIGHTIGHPNDSFSLLFCKPPIK